MTFFFSNLALDHDVIKYHLLAFRKVQLFKNRSIFDPVMADLIRQAQILSFLSLIFAQKKHEKRQFSSKNAVFDPCYFASASDLRPFRRLAT